jgi:cytidine deaminase
MPSTECPQTNNLHNNAGVSSTREVSIVTTDELLAAARDARTRARCDYSHFAVGAALLSTSGRVFTGCNIENASYGLTVCAERVALWKALSEGTDRFTHLAIVADTQSHTPPCGACRQLLWEFTGDIEIILGNLTSLGPILHLKDLLPYPFDAQCLKQ